MAELTLEVEIGHFVASGIIVEHTVEAYGFGGYDGGAEFELRLEGSGSADAYHSEGAVVGAHFACFKVDIGRGVELVDHYVDIVGAYAVAQTHYGLALVGATYGVELARRYLEGAGVEK